MRELLEAALAATRKGETVALATIVSAKGSTPRATGAKLPCLVESHCFLEALAVFALS